MLLVDSVVFRYRQEQAPIVNKVSFGVHPGEFVAVMGTNGSGKSTVARLLNGLLKPQDGSVTVDGLDTSQPNDLWRIRSKVGMVFQNPENQMVAPTVEDDIAFGLENLGVPPKEMRKRVDYALETMGLSRYADSPPSRLSGGEKQRVAIAGILAMQPCYLVLDEAGSMLDPRGRKELLNIVWGLRAEGMGIVMITQQAEEVINADTLVVLDKGKVVMTGKPREILEKDPVKLADLGIASTAMGKLAAKLRNRGLNLPQGVLTVDEMVRGLC